MGARTKCNHQTKSMAALELSRQNLALTESQETGFISSFSHEVGVTLPNGCLTSLLHLGPWEWEEEGFRRKHLNSPQLLHSFKKAKISQDPHHCCLSAGQNSFRSSFLTPDSHLVLLKGLHPVSCGRGFHGR